MQTPNGAAVVGVDASTGSLSPQPSFPSASAVPEALAVDPYDGDLLLACEGASPGQSRIVRLHRVGAAMLELPIGTLPGPVVDLCVVDDSVCAAVGGAGPQAGVYRLPRRVGAAGPAVATQVLALPNLGALDWTSESLAMVTIAWTGVPGTSNPDSGVASVDLTTGAFVFGPFVFPPTAQQVTGVVELPTAVPRYVMSHASGQLSIFDLGAAGWSTLPITPSLPGGAVALRDGHLLQPGAVAVGGASHPYVVTFDTGFTQWANLSPALPGRPVDLVHALRDDARSHPYGAACGPVAVGHSSSGLPWLGSTYVLSGHGPANDALLFACGLDDVALGALPLALPGGCELLVRPDLLLMLPTGANGMASWTFVVPPATTLLGVALHSQWAHLGAAGLSVSSATVSWIGN